MNIHSPESRTIISRFSGLFLSKKVFEHAVELLVGVLISVGRRTVCGALRALGRSGEKRFHKYHRVLSHARWSARRGGQIVLNLLIERFGGAEPLIFGLDETLERRWGRRIKARGIYRDAVRSSHSHFVKCSGLRWMSLMFLAPISWAGRVWALPFLTVLAPSERYCREAQKRHKKLTDWARQMALQLRRWLPKRQIIVVADSSYAALELLNAVRQYLCFIVRFRLDAALYDPPAEGKNRGRPRLKGKRQPTLAQRLNDPATEWQLLSVPTWYGLNNKPMLIASSTALWYHVGKPPVPIRWVLIKDPEGKTQTTALLATDLQLDALQILSAFIRRWTLEVTFQEVRTHLGVESQRQWSDQAIARSTPVLLALFSIVTLWSDALQQRQPILQTQAAWYNKQKPTFSDAIAAVRIDLWNEPFFLTSDSKTDIKIIPSDIWRAITSALARAA